MCDKDIWRPDALTISSVTESYPLCVANYDPAIKVLRNVMDTMHAKLMINGQYVNGVVRRVDMYKGSFGIFDVIRLEVDDFDKPQPKVKKVIYNDPATIIFWTDGTKTVVKCQEGDTYSKEKGFVMAYLKKMLGNDNTFNKEINKWVPKEEPSNRVAESYTYDEQSDVFIFRDYLGNTILELPRELTRVMRFN